MNYQNQLLEAAPDRVIHCQRIMRIIWWGSHDLKASPHNMGGVFYVDVNILNNNDNEGFISITDIKGLHTFTVKPRVLQFTAMCAIEGPSSSSWIKNEATLSIFLAANIKTNVRLTLPRHVVIVWYVNPIESFKSKNTEKTNFHMYLRGLWIFHANFFWLKLSEKFEDLEVRSGVSSVHRMSTLETDPVGK